MPRKPQLDVPPFRVHKGTGQAYVNIDGRRRYLGRADLPEARSRYDRLVAEYLANGRRLTLDTDDLSVVELTAAFMRWVRDYYKASPNELDHFSRVAAMLDRLYGGTEAATFGPKLLKAVRQAMVNAGWRRQHTNKMTVRLRRIFKWGAENELVPASVFHALQCVPGLKRGRSEARETEPVRPVPEEHVLAVCEHVPLDVATMLRLQLLTAARPGELVILRPIDLDTSERVWLYKPARHKTQHHGHDRVIYLGPCAQAVLARLLAGVPVEGYVFSPKRAIARRHAEAPTHRRPDQRPNPRKTDRTVGDRYDTNSYRRCVTRACKAVGVPAFSLHAIRHTAATRIRREFGLEAAQLLCGHARADVTQFYAEVNAAKAFEVARRIG